MKADGPSHIGSRTKVIIASLVVVLAIASAVLILNANDSDTSDKYGVSINLGDGIESVTGGGEFKEGTEITLEAELEDGKAFLGWYDSSNNLVSSDNPFVVKVVSDQRYTAKATDQCTLEIVIKKGIDHVSGAGQYHHGQQVTVTADPEEGYSFLGWFSDEGLLSKNTTYTFEIGDSISIYAYGESQRMVVETSTGVFEFISPVNLDSSLLWTVTSNDTKGVVGTYRSDEQVLDPDGGSYTVRLTGKVCGEAYSHSETFIDYGQVSKTFRWTYDGVSYSFVWTLSYSTYLSWRNNNSIDRWPSTDEERTSYVTDSTSSIRSISDYLESCSLSMTELERADFVLKFVESTEYVSDSISRNKAEWFKYPIETLFDKGGDCEDTSILYCTLMHNLGYDVALLHFPSSLGYEAGHMAAAVAVSDCSGRYYLVDGEKYYYCETTSNWDVGVPWEEYTTAYVLVIE